MKNFEPEPQKRDFLLACPLDHLPDRLWPGLKVLLARDTNFLKDLNRKPVSLANLSTSIERTAILMVWRTLMRYSEKAIHPSIYQNPRLGIDARQAKESPSVESNADGSPRNNSGI